MALMEANARGQIRGAVAASRRAFLAIGVFTAAINLLMLSGSFFMLQVYDRVIPSRSVPTLIGLIVLVTMLYGFQGILDFIRQRLLVRTARGIDEHLGQYAYRAIVQLPLTAGNAREGLQPVRDLDQIRSFLSSLGPTALFDLPWIPLYLGLCFVFHFWIGMTALVGAVLLVALTLFTEVLTRSPVKASAGYGAVRMGLVEGSRRNAEVLRSMGMTERMSERWSRSNDQYLDAQQKASDVVGGLGATSRVFRMLLQSFVLAVGAYLVINQQASAGVIIASSILTSRALAPVELAIAHWKNFAAARQSWARLKDVIEKLTSTNLPMSLPRPTSSLSVEAVSVAPPGVPRLVVQNASFRLEAGQGLGIIGPSASGKSTLARSLVGVWQVVRGKIRIDGAALDQWDPESLGAHIGYVPQDVELFDGTIAENIARFATQPNPDDVIDAARQAAIHDMILRLPDGYETKIGEGGSSLSAGQRQRVALARALYGSPFLVVLDEPNSNLDAEGDQALTRAIAAVRTRGGIVVVVAHRAAALSAVDMVLVMAEGLVQNFGPKDEVLSKVLEQPRMGPKMPIAVFDSGKRA
ncbi:type I secretion system permease/ATPase [Tardiphaga sp. vice352]|uniref:type I secretion system permease/ATPase n=1 Tax=Tardiphaga sp. vice352 TaxID=2592816 RepID=UPI001162ACF5|nr:type I secretion system permease/ATPase [Tardiphaga sp. vice352]QDM34492.1 type I secretion system permease/ATPase [Tardiphaga sp. vice352]